MRILIDSLLPPPNQAREAQVDWLTVQATLRTSLPDDYKGFIHRYGTGKIDGFIWVLNPIASNPGMNLIARGIEILDAFREYRTTVAALGKLLPYAAFPEPEGLLPWGVTENGDVCYWQTGGASPNSWRVVINDSRGSMWEKFDGGMTAFVAAILSREFVSEILTDAEFPSKSASVQSQMPAS